jgi:hypothetical protein
MSEIRTIYTTTLFVGGRESSSTNAYRQCWIYSFFRHNRENKLTMNVKNLLNNNNNYTYVLNSVLLYQFPPRSFSEKSSRHEPINRVEVS